VKSDSAPTKIGNIALAAAFLILNSYRSARLQIHSSAARNNRWRIRPHRTHRLVSYLFEETDLS